MDPVILSLLIAKVILINTRNLFAAVEKAKANDGKVTTDELPEIVLGAAIKSLDDLGVGDLRGLLGQVKK